MLCGRERCLVGGPAAGAVVGLCGGVEAADEGGFGNGVEEGEGEGGTESWLEGHGGLDFGVAFDALMFRATRAAGYCGLA